MESNPNPKATEKKTEKIFINAWRDNVAKYTAFN
jgi:hypothetical protein